MRAKFIQEVRFRNGSTLAKVWFGGKELYWLSSGYQNPIVIPVDSSGQEILEFKAQGSCLNSCENEGGNE